jgi:hypothetical protein
MEMLISVLKWLFIESIYGIAGIAVVIYITLMRAFTITDGDMIKVIEG